MNRFIGAIFLHIFFMGDLVAQQGHYSIGARSMGMANASVTIFDDYAAFNNPAGLSKIKNQSIFFSSKNYYGIAGLLTIGAGFNSQLFSGVITTNFIRFGDQLYNEHKIGLGFGHKIRFISLGLQLDFIQLNIEGYGSKRWLSFEFGGIIEVSKKAVFAAHIFNLYRALFQLRDHSIPVIIRGGFSYHPIEFLMLNIEYENVIERYSLIKLGLEYSIRGKLFFRTGVVIDNSIPTFGIGFNPRKFHIDYSLAIHPILGCTQELSISFKPIKK